MYNEGIKTVVRNGLGVPSVKLWDKSAKSHRNCDILIALTFEPTAVKTIRSQDHAIQFTFIEAHIRAFEMRITG